MQIIRFYSGLVDTFPYGSHQKNTQKKANPIMMGFAGFEPSPKAFRTKLKTITICVKLVVNITIDGANISNVINKANSMLGVQSLPFSKLKLFH